MLQAQIFIDKDEMKGSEVLYEYILKFLIAQKIKGATVFRGMFGYRGNRYLAHPSKLFSFDEIPIMVTFVDEEEKVRSALTLLRKEIKSGLFITHSVDVW